MKLTVSHVAKVSTAEVVLDGITVVAGYNGMGKSTIGKALDAMLSAYGDLDDAISAERSRSAEAAIRTWQTGQNGGAITASAAAAAKTLLARLKETAFSADALEAEVERVFPPSEVRAALVDELRVVLNRSEGEYIDFLVARAFDTCFSGQINTLDESSVGEVTLEIGQNTNTVQFQNNTLLRATHNRMGGCAPIYLGARSLRDSLEDVRGYSLFTQPDDLTLEEYRVAQRSKKQIHQILKQVIKGHIHRTSDGSTLFLEDGTQTPLDFSNVAAGLRLFLQLQQLVQSGRLREGGVLIIDEPEVNMHPNRQIKLAELICLLYKEMNIMTLMNSSSPYLIRAIEVLSARHDLAHQCRYYYMDDCERRAAARDVTEQTEEIYRSLYAPLEKL